MKYHCIQRNKHTLTLVLLLEKLQSLKPAICILDQRSGCAGGKKMRLFWKHGISNCTKWLKM